MERKYQKLAEEPVSGLKERLLQLVKFQIGSHKCKFESFFHKDLPGSCSCVTNTIISDAYPYE
jgi:hypothetical protein